MAIVTLTTDYGLRDHDLATLKGALLRQDPSLQLVDISHQVENYNIVQAAYLFANAWPAFPTGTIHILSVNEIDTESPRVLCLMQEEQFFLAPDNGLFSLVFETLPDNCRAIPVPLDSSYPLGNAYAGAVSHLLDKGHTEELGRKAGEIVQRLSFHPVIGPTMIQGNIIYIDNFDNAVTNIRAELFEKVGQGREFALYFKRTDPIKRLVQHYHQAPLGSPLCRFNSAGFLEVAINKGKAISLLGLSLEDTVQVKFKP